MPLQHPHLLPCITILHHVRHLAAPQEVLLPVRIW